MENNNRKIGLAVPRVVLPDEQVDMRKWAVVACDQYVSEPKYWSEVEKYVGTSASTLHIMLPEIYLGEHDMQSRRAGSYVLFHFAPVFRFTNILVAGYYRPLAHIYLLVRQDDTRYGKSNLSIVIFH